MSLAITKRPLMDNKRSALLFRPAMPGRPFSSIESRHRPLRVLVGRACPWRNGRARNKSAVDNTQKAPKLNPMLCCACTWSDQSRGTRGGQKLTPWQQLAERAPDVLSDRSILSRTSQLCPRKARPAVLNHLLLRIAQCLPIMGDIQVFDNNTFTVTRPIYPDGSDCGWIGTMPKKVSWR